MASPAQSRLQYHFGVYTVDPQACELRKLGSRILLQERPLRLLMALLERPGEVVTREELRRELWPDGTFVDFDHNIGSAVNKLRTALNDSARHPLYVETVGRRGYRFIGHVRQAASAPQVVGPVPVAPPAVTVLKPRSSRLRLFLLSALLLTASVAAYLQWSNSRAV